MGFVINAMCSSSFVLVSVADIFEADRAGTAAHDDWRETNVELVAPEE